MMKLALLAMLALGLWACGDTGTSDGRSGEGGIGGTGLVGVDLETHCRAWCEPETGCSDAQTTPVQCLDSCLASAEQDPCFGHVVTYQECVLAMECADPFEDCEAPGGLPRIDPDAPPSCEVFENAYARCTCENLPPPSGTGGVGGATQDCSSLTNPPPGCDELCPSGSDSECELGTFCSNGVCSAQCTAAEGCGEGSTCNSRGRCVPDVGTQ